MIPLSKEQEDAEKQIRVYLSLTGYLLILIGLFAALFDVYSLALKVGSGAGLQPAWSVVDRMAAYNLVLIAAAISWTYLCDNHILRKKGDLQ